MYKNKRLYSIEREAIDIKADIILIPYFAEVIVGDKAERIQALQFSALRQLQARLHYYDQRGYSDKLINAIAEKKAEMIMQTTTKTEMDKVLHAPAPHYTGGGFVTDQYCVPEEELIGWSETSLRGPLIPAGLKRYMELFKMVFPEKEIL